MFDHWKRHRAASRVSAGDGRTLQRFRWWQLPGRALFYLRCADTEYAIDIRHWQNQSSGEVKADLYLDGLHVAESKLPAAFTVGGGVIEVAMSGFGLKRCHFITDGGSEHQLRPDPASAEGRRARMDRRHPRASRMVGAVSATVLVVSVAILLLQLAEAVSHAPPIADSIGTFTSPISLSLWPNLALTLASVIASTERALRLRFYWLLDAAAN